MKANQIKYERGDVWVLEKDGAFYVMITGVTHSTSDSAYETLELAIIRCDYLATRRAPKKG